jgi:resuscitation-promoting factor RpfB
VTFRNRLRSASTSKCREGVEYRLVAPSCAAQFWFIAETCNAQTAEQCDPNYFGACVPTASDVDCTGGSGNGPAYVREPVYVVGTDIYGLDRDKDGIGCE